MGIQLARANQPEVILMDINLPGISGLEALKILRDDPATAHIPVVALSANAMPRDIEKGLEAGFFSYLTKPIKVTEFMEALDAALAAARTRVPERPRDPPGEDPGRRRSAGQRPPARAHAGRRRLHRGHVHARPPRGVRAARDRTATT